MNIPVDIAGGYYIFNHFIFPLSYTRFLMSHLGKGNPGIKPCLIGCLYNIIYLLLIERFKSLCRLHGIGHDGLYV